MYQVIGFSTTTGADGKKRSTLHTVTDFEAFQNDATSGRSASGKAVEAIYVGEVDISKLKVGDLVDVYYGKPIMKKDGSFFAPVVALNVVKDK